MLHDANGLGGWDRPCCARSGTSAVWVRDIGRPGQGRHWLDFLADVFTLTGTSQRIGWQISLIWREYGPGNSWVLS